VNLNVYSIRLVTKSQKHKNFHAMTWLYPDRSYDSYIIWWPIWTYFGQDI